MAPLNIPTAPSDRVRTDVILPATPKIHNDLIHEKEARPVFPSLSIVRGLLVLQFPGHIWRDGIGFHFRPGLCDAGAPQIQFHALYVKHLPSAWSDKAALMVGKVVKGILSSTFRFLSVIWQLGEMKTVNRRKKIRKMCVLLQERRDLHSYEKNKIPTVASFVQVLSVKNGLLKQSHTQTISDVHFSERYPCTPFLSE